jgi:hypothetical protein
MTADTISAVLNNAIVESQTAITAPPDVLAKNFL